MPTAEIPVVSMSDIAFLLIVFFLCATQFMQRGMRLDMPRAEKEQKQAQEKTVTVTIAGKDSIMLNNNSIKMEQLVPLLDKELEGKETPEERAVVVRCVNQATYELFVEVIDAIKLVRATPVLEIEEKKGGGS